MNYNASAQREMNDQQRQCQEALVEQRIRTIEMTLVSHNETTERVLAACRRIQWSWSKPKETEDE